jgi:hypothetical protein
VSALRNLRHFEFHRLAFGRGLDQQACGGNAAAGGDLFQDFVRHDAAVDDRLNAFET